MTHLFKQFRHIIMASIAAFIPLYNGVVEAFDLQPQYPTMEISKVIESISYNNNGTYDIKYKISISNTSTVPIPTLWLLDSFGDNTVNPDFDNISIEHDQTFEIGRVFIGRNDINGDQFGNDFAFEIVDADNAQDTDKVAIAAGDTIDIFVKGTFNGSMSTCSSSNTNTVYLYGYTSSGDANPVFVTPYSTQLSDITGDDFTDNSVCKSLSTVRLDLKKEAIAPAPVYNGDGTWTVNYKVTIENTGSEAVKQVDFVDVFGGVASGANIEIQSPGMLDVFSTNISGGVAMVNSYSVNRLGFTAHSTDNDSILLQPDETLSFPMTVKIDGDENLFTGDCTIENRNKVYIFTYIDSSDTLVLLNDTDLSIEAGIGSDIENNYACQPSVALVGPKLILQIEQGEAIPKAGINSVFDYSDTFNVLNYKSDSTISNLTPVSTDYITVDEILLAYIPEPGVKTGNGTPLNNLNSAMVTDASLSGYETFGSNCSVGNGPDVDYIECIKEAVYTDNNPVQSYLEVAMFNFRGWWDPLDNDNDLIAPQGPSEYSQSHYYPLIKYSAPLDPSDSFILNRSHGYVDYPDLLSAQYVDDTVCSDAYYKTLWLAGLKITENGLDLDGDGNANEAGVILTKDEINNLVENGVIELRFRNATGAIESTLTSDIDHSTSCSDYDNVYIPQATINKTVEAEMIDTNNDNTVDGNKITYTITVDNFNTPFNIPYFYITDMLPTEVQITQTMCETGDILGNGIQGVWSATPVDKCTFLLTNGEKITITNENPSKFVGVFDGINGTLSTNTPSNNPLYAAGMPNISTDIDETNIWTIAYYAQNAGETNVNSTLLTQSIYTINLNFLLPLSTDLGNVYCVDQNGIPAINQTTGDYIYPVCQGGVVSESNYPSCSRITGEVICSSGEPVCPTGLSVEPICGELLCNNIAQKVGPDCQIAGVKEACIVLNTCFDYQGELKTEKELQVEDAVLLPGQAFAYMITTTNVGNIPLNKITLLDASTEQTILGFAGTVHNVDGSIKGTINYTLNTSTDPTELLYPSNYQTATSYLEDIDNNTLNNDTELLQPGEYIKVMVYSIYAPTSLNEPRNYVFVGSLDPQYVEGCGEGVSNSDNCSWSGEDNSYIFINPNDVNTIINTNAQQAEEFINSFGVCSDAIIQPGVDDYFGTPTPWYIDKELNESVVDINTNEEGVQINVGDLVTYNIMIDFGNSNINQIDWNLVDIIDILPSGFTLDTITIAGQDYVIPTDTTINLGDILANSNLENSTDPQCALFTNTTYTGQYTNLPAGAIIISDNNVDIDSNGNVINAGLYTELQYYYMTNVAGFGGMQFFYNVNDMWGNNNYLYNLIGSTNVEYAIYACKESITTVNNILEIQLSGSFVDESATLLCNNATIDLNSTNNPSFTDTSNDEDTLDNNSTIDEQGSELEDACVTVLPDIPNLVITKILENTETGVNSGYNYSSADTFNYIVAITNNGTTPYTGTIRIDDNPQNGIVIMSVQTQSGQNISYTSNTVTSDANDFYITQSGTINEGDTYYYTITAGVGSMNGTEFVPATILETGGALTPSTCPDTTMNSEYDVNESAHNFGTVGGYVNTATLSLVNDDGSLTMIGDPDTACVDITGITIREPNVSIEKHATNIVVENNKYIVTYQITVSNAAGSGTATNIIVQDIVNNGGIMTSITPSNSCTIAQLTGTGCVISNLEGGENMTISVTVEYPITSLQQEIDITDTGYCADEEIIGGGTDNTVLSNTATVNISGGEVEDTDDGCVNPEVIPTDWDVEKALTTTPTETIDVQDEVSYTITLDLGNLTVNDVNWNNVDITDALPSGYNVSSVQINEVPAMPIVPADSSDGVIDLADYITVLTDDYTSEPQCKLFTKYNQYFNSTLANYENVPAGTELVSEMIGGIYGDPYRSISDWQTGNTSIYHINMYPYTQVESYYFYGSGNYPAASINGDELIPNVNDAVTIPFFEQFGIDRYYEFMPAFNYYACKTDTPFVQSGNTITIVVTGIHTEENTNACNTVTVSGNGTNDGYMDDTAQVCHPVEMVEVVFNADKTIVQSTFDDGVDTLSYDITVSNTGEAALGNDEEPVVLYDELEQYMTATNVVYNGTTYPMTPNNDLLLQDNDADGVISVGDVYIDYYPFTVDTMATYDLVGSDADQNPSSDWIAFNYGILAVNEEIVIRVNTSLDVSQINTIEETEADAGICNDFWAFAPTPEDAFAGESGINSVALIGPNVSDDQSYIDRYGVLWADKKECVCTAEQLENGLCETINIVKGAGVYNPDTNTMDFPITITNEGTQAIPHIIMVDTFETTNVNTLVSPTFVSNTTGVIVYPSAQLAANGCGSLQNGMVCFDVDNVPAGDTIITMSLPVANNAVGEICNTQIAGVLWNMPTQYPTVFGAAVADAIYAEEQCGTILDPNAPIIDIMKTASAATDDNNDGIYDIEYTITMSNTGLTDAVNVVFTDTPGSGIDIDVDAITYPVGVDLVVNNGQGTFTIGVLSPNEEVVITIPATINIPQNGIDCPSEMYTNTVEFTSAEYINGSNTVEITGEIDTSNNEVCVDPEEQTPSFSLDKQLISYNPATNEVVYNVVVSIGNAPYTGAISITDTPGSMIDITNVAGPSGYTTTATGVSGTNYGGVVSINTASNTYPVGDYTYVITGVVNGVVPIDACDGTTTSYTNTAVITVPTNDGDSSTGTGSNNESSDCVGAINIVKEASGDGVYAMNEDFTYTLTITNDATTTQIITVKDKSDSGVTLNYYSITGAVSGNTTSNIDITSNPFTTGNIEIAAGGTVIILVNATMNADINTTITDNTSATNCPAGTNNGINNQATVLINDTVVAGDNECVDVVDDIITPTTPVVSIDKWATSYNTSTGAVSYTIQMVVNNGPVSNVVLTDTAGSGLTIGSITSNTLPAGCSVVQLTNTGCTLASGTYTFVVNGTINSNTTQTSFTNTSCSSDNNSSNYVDEMYYGDGTGYINTASVSYTYDGNTITIDNDSCVDTNTTPVDTPIVALNKTQTSITESGNNYVITYNVAVNITNATYNGTLSFIENPGDALIITGISENSSAINLTNSAITGVAGGNITITLAPTNASNTIPTGTYNITVTATTPMNTVPADPCNPTNGGDYVNTVEYGNDNDGTGNNAVCLEVSSFTVNKAFTSYSNGVLTYTITITNTGNAVIHQLNVVEYPDEIMTLTGVSGTTLSTANGDIIATDYTNWVDTGLTITSGQSVQYTLTAIVNSQTNSANDMFDGASCGVNSIRNAVIVSATYDDNTIDTEQDDVCIDNPDDENTDVTMYKTASTIPAAGAIFGQWPLNMSVGTEFYYILTFYNTGLESTVDVSDTAPTGIEFVVGSLDLQGYTAASTSLTTTQLQINDLVIPANDSVDGGWVTIRFTAKVTSLATDICSDDDNQNGTGALQNAVLNTATMTLSDGTVQSNPACVTTIDNVSSRTPILSVEKSVELLETTYQADGRYDVEYTITVSNTGDVDAVGVQVIDVPQDGIGLLGSLSQTVTVPANTSIIITYTGVINTNNASGVCPNRGYNNAVGIMSGGADTIFVDDNRPADNDDNNINTPADDAVCVEIPTSPTPVVPTIQKTVNTPVLSVGSDFVYTLTITNSNSTAYTVDVKDIEPAGVQFISYQIGGGAVQNIASTATELMIEDVVIPANGSVVIAINAQISSVLSGTSCSDDDTNTGNYTANTVINTAQILDATTGAVLGSNPTCITTPVVDPTTPQYDIEKTATIQTFSTGSSFNYVMVIQNTNNVAGVVNVSDTAPNGIDFVCPAVITGATNNGTIVCNAGTFSATGMQIAAGGTVNITLGATVESDVTGDLGACSDEDGPLEGADNDTTQSFTNAINNTVSLQVQGGTGGTITNNTCINQVIPTTPVVPTIQKTVNTPSLSVGSNFVYTLTITNSNSTAYTVDVKDIEPAGVQFISYQIGGGAVQNIASTATELMIEDVVIPANGSVVIAINAQIISVLSGTSCSDDDTNTGNYTANTVINTAQILTPNTTTVLGSNSTCITTPVVNPSLEVSKTGVLNNDNTITYTIKVWNTGNVNMQNIVLTDTVQSGIQLANSYQIGNQSVLFGAGNTINIASVPTTNTINNPIIITFTGTFTAAEMNTNAAQCPTNTDNLFNNHIELTSATYTNNGTNTTITDTDTDTDTNDDVCISPLMPAIHITKVANNASNLMPGDSFTYTITVTNTGATTLDNIVITDTPEAGIVINSVSMGTLTGTNPYTIELLTTTTLAPGASINITLNATVADTILQTGQCTAQDTLSNTASVVAQTPSDTLVNDTTDTPTNVVVMNTVPAYMMSKTVSTADGDMILEAGEDTLTYAINVVVNEYTPSIMITDVFPCDVFTYQNNATITNNATLNTTVGACNTTQNIDFTITNIPQNVAMGTTYTINFTAKIKSDITLQSGTYCNSIEAECTPEEDEHTACVVYNTPNVLDLAINKTGPSTVSMDANGAYTFNYTITVSNIGTQNATNVAVQETPGSGITLQSYTINGATVAMPTTNIIPVGALNIGQTNTITIAATLTPESDNTHNEGVCNTSYGTNTYLNTATVGMLTNGSVVDDNAPNDPATEDTDTHCITPLTDDETVINISVDKSVVANYPYVDSDNDGKPEVVFMIVVGADGTPNTLIEDIVLTDTAGVGMTLLGYSETLGGAYTAFTTAPYSIQIGDYTIPNSGTGTVKTYYIKAELTPTITPTNNCPLAGMYQNTASVVENSDTETDMEDNTDTVCIELPEEPVVDIVLEKRLYVNNTLVPLSEQPKDVDADDVISYELVLTNNGDTDYTNSNITNCEVALYDTLPTGMTFGTIVSSTSEYNTMTNTNNTLKFCFDKVVKGDTIAVKFTVNASNMVSGDVCNVFGTTPITVSTGTQDEGEACGGFTPTPQVCATGLVCTATDPVSCTHPNHTTPCIADLPGICTDNTDVSNEVCVHYDRPNLAIYKVVNDNSVDLGQSFTYTITVINTGSVAATNVSVSDTAEAPIVLTSASNNGVITGQNVLWTGLTIPAATATGPGVITLQVSGSIANTPANILSIASHSNTTGCADSDSDTGTYDVQEPSGTHYYKNTASITQYTYDGDIVVQPTNTSDNACVDPILVIPPANNTQLAITKAVNNATVALGGELTYTLTVVVSGNTPAQNVVISDTLSDTEFDTTSVQCVTNCTGYSYDSATKTVKYTISTLPIGTHTYSFKVKVNQQKCGNVVNNAMITAANAPQANSNQTSTAMPTDCTCNNTCGTTTTNPTTSFTNGSVGTGTTNYSTSGTTTGITNPPVRPTPLPMPRELPLCSIEYCTVCTNADGTNLTKQVDNNGVWAEETHLANGDMADYKLTLDLAIDGKIATTDTKLIIRGVTVKYYDTYNSDNNGAWLANETVVSSGWNVIDQGYNVFEYSCNDREGTPNEQCSTLLDRLTDHGNGEITLLYTADVALAGDIINSHSVENYAFAEVEYDYDYIMGTEIMSGTEKGIIGKNCKMPATPSKTASEELDYITYADSATVQIHRPKADFKGGNTIKNTAPERDVLYNYSDNEDDIEEQNDTFSMPTNTRTTDIANYNDIINDATDEVNSDDILSFALRGSSEVASNCAVEPSVYSTEYDNVYVVKALGCDTKAYIKLTEYAINTSQTYLFDSNTIQQVALPDDVMTPDNTVIAFIGNTNFHFMNANNSSTTIEKDEFKGIIMALENNKITSDVSYDQMIINGMISGDLYNFFYNRRYLGATNEDDAVVVYPLTELENPDYMPPLVAAIAAQFGIDEE